MTDEPVHLSPDWEVDALRREGLIDPPDGPGARQHDGSGRVQLSFSPSGREVRVPPGVSVFDAASWNGIAIDSTCGGHGTCKKCKVQLVQGSTPVHRLDQRSFNPEQLAAGWRLACLAQATQDLSVDVPPLTTRPKAATLGVGRQVILRPALQKRYVELAEPTLSDQRTDLQRLYDAIDDLELTPDLHALRRLPTVLRSADYQVTAVIVDDALIDIEPGDTTARRFAIAFDLGTTTVVATLIDTATGTPAAVASMLNKQQPFGGDVITRISATMLDPEALPRLRSLAQETLAELAGEVLAEAGVEPGEVYEAALAGNATMTALMLGIDPEPIGVAPFVMSTATLPPVLASELGLSLHPGARAFIFPALGAYVGGDIVSGMLASGMDRDKRTRLFIDVGTNCEIVLSNGDTIVSTAALPVPRSRAARSAAACAPPTAPSRWSASTRRSRAESRSRSSGTSSHGGAAMQAMKTGALIRAAVRMGAILGGADNDALGHLTAYAEAAGRAFQLADDLLDVTASTEAMGKATGKDAGARQADPRRPHRRRGGAPALGNIVHDAITALTPFGPEADTLREAAALFRDAGKLMGDIWHLSRANPIATPSACCSAPAARCCDRRGHPRGVGLRRASCADRLIRPRSAGRSRARCSASPASGSPRPIS